MTIIILAAGLSKRMENNQNKLLLPYKGKTILDSTIQSAIDSNNNVIVVTGHDRDKIKEIISKYNITEIYNKDYEDGQISSTLAGIKALKDGEDFAIVHGDLPLVKPQIYKRGQIFLDFSNIIRPKYKNTFGHPVFLKAAMKDKILKENPKSMKEFCNKYGFLTIEEDISTTFDIDTMEKYNKLF